MKYRFVLAIFVFLSSAKAFAWSGGGHKIVALFAYEQLDEETRNAVVELLRNCLNFSTHGSSAVQYLCGLVAQRRVYRLTYSDTGTACDMIARLHGNASSGDASGPPRRSSQSAACSATAS